jgi:hypothetical protein
MYPDFIRRAVVTAVLGSVAVSCTGVAWAQRQRQRQPPQEQKEWDDTGTVEGIVGNAVQMMSSRSEPWAVQVVPGQSKVIVEGTAEPSFLRSGVNIQFDGEIDAKGSLQGEIKELEIYSPQGKSDAGLFPQGAEEGAKPIAKMIPGSYTVKGRITSLKENQIMVVAAGKKISGMLAETPAIKVNSSDLGYVQKGDAVKVKGWYTDSTKYDPTKGRVGAVLAQEITVTMSEPLVGKKKARPAKAKSKASDAENLPANDPFGIGSGK